MKKMTIYSVLLLLFVGFTFYSGYKEKQFEKEQETLTEEDANNAQLVLMQILSIIILKYKYV